MLFGKCYFACHLSKLLPRLQTTLFSSKYKQTNSLFPGHRSSKMDSHTVFFFASPKFFFFCFCVVSFDIIYSALICISPPNVGPQEQLDLDCVVKVDREQWGNCLRFNWLTCGLLPTSLAPYKDRLDHY